MLVELIPKVAIQLSRIDDERFWTTSSYNDREIERAEDKESLPETDTEKRETVTNAIPTTDSTWVPSHGSNPLGQGSQGLQQNQRDGTPFPEDQPGRGQTATDREAYIRVVKQKQIELERLLREATSAGVVPIDPNEPEKRAKREFQSDERFRNAVMDYERKRGRFPQSKMGSQAGHDIDSFDSVEGNLNRKLVRRIEVKGKGVPWQGEEIVEQSDRQYRDAWHREIEPETPVAHDCDYWLYVVEDDGIGKLNVLPIRNPAQQAAHYEFRAGTWRHIAEVESDGAME